MADGSQAAADAAREAREEVLEQEQPAKPPESKAQLRKRVREEKAAEKVKAKKLGYKNFLVNVWVTDFNPYEFGIYKHKRNRAKSRQFTADTDIIAEVVEDGKRTGVIGYREALWKQRTGTDKRLVFKLFNETLNWRATMDLMLARSLQKTLGARGIPVMSFAVNLANYNFVVYVERSDNKWPLMPDNFSFFLMDERQPRFYRLRRAFISLGGDYTIYDQKDTVIGHIDGKLLSFGKWYGTVREDHADRNMMMVLQLFSAMLGFHRTCKRHVRDLAQDVMSGAVKPSLERQETDLYMNPRRVR